ncbi:MAG: hypothetical protein ACI4F7_04860 [Acutalibacteraceae bacterium]
MRKDSEAAFCVCQAAEWECNCYDGEKTFELFEAARDFKADIIVMRLVENCTRDNNSLDSEDNKNYGLDFRHRRLNTEWM